jgi:hypothetical protein
LQYTLSIITSQLYCFQLVTTLNGKDFKFFSHGLCTEKQNILLQHMHEIDLEPRFRVNAYFHIISRMFWRRMFCFSVHSPWEKNLKSFPIKMVLSWKQCSCDVIERVYWEFQKCTCSDRPLFAPVICSWRIILTNLVPRVCLFAGYVVNRHTLGMRLYSHQLFVGKLTN